jgi:hypothetical protein
MITSASGAKLGRVGATALLAVAAAFSLSATPALAAAPAISSAARPSASQVAPPGRTWASFAYDAARYQLVLFGGNNQGTEGGYQGDTWVWTGRTWRQLHPATSPSPGTTPT